MKKVTAVFRFHLSTMPADLLNTCDPVYYKIDLPNSSSEGTTLNFVSSYDHKVHTGVSNFENCWSVFDLLLPDTLTNPSVFPKGPSVGVS